MDITTIVEAVIALAMAVITGVLIPYIKSKTTKAQREELREWARIAVQAAEQIYEGDGRGAEKKAYVINWLKERGVTLDADKLDALVESTVYEMFW